MALANATILKPQTALQQLLEEINFQRTKEMRQLLKDDGGFVVLQGTTYWTDLFVRHFLFQSESDHNIDSDDLLFFVRKKHIKSSSRHMPKYETEVDVYRKDSRKLPIGDPDVDWEETVYLNLIIHQFNYTLTLAICTRTSPKELQVLRRHSQRVYASPSRRKMDTKGEGEEMTYPHICFMVDNFDEVFCDIMVRDGEMVCVELVASDRDGAVQGVIFLGSIRYDALKKVYDARQSSISTKLAQRMTFGIFSSGGPQTRCEFVRMKGPQGKGHAEMAVTKPKGSGVETPTSEPGFCVTDMWDEWDEDPDDFLNYRHQRRLSDPSANLNNYSRYGWKTKTNGCGDAVSSKARSENEGLDSLANEVSEIEAGDLKDDRPASSTHDHPKNSLPAQAEKPSKKCEPKTETIGSLTRTTSDTASTCCNCFGPINGKWNDSMSGQMSDVYCRTCDDNDEDIKNAIDHINSPACLTNVTVKRKQATFINYAQIQKNILNVESELEFMNTKLKFQTGLSMSRSDAMKNGSHCDSPRREKLKTAIEATDTNCKDTLNNNTSASSIDYEIADDATAFNDNANENHCDRIDIMTDADRKFMIHGREELPAKEQTATVQIHDHSAISSDSFSTNANKSNIHQAGDSKTLPAAMTKKHSIKTNCTNNHPLLEMKSNDSMDDDFMNDSCQIRNSSTGKKALKSSVTASKLNRLYSTLPRTRKSILDQMSMCHKRTMKQLPTRITPDGTTIFYWCDLSKQTLKELDDGAYNPLWATRGFTQTFHFWKEHRRQQSVPLNAFLTYVTLPWWSIAKDLLDHRETPILTF